MNLITQCSMRTEEQSILTFFCFLFLPFSLPTKKKKEQPRATKMIPRVYLLIHIFLRLYTCFHSFSCLTSTSSTRTFLFISCLRVTTRLSLRALPQAIFTHSVLYKNNCAVRFPFIAAYICMETEQIEFTISCDFYYTRNYMKSKGFLKLIFMTEIYFHLGDS